MEIQRSDAADAGAGADAWWQVAAAAGQSVVLAEGRTLWRGSVLDLPITALYDGGRRQPHVTSKVIVTPSCPCYSISLALALLPDTHACIHPSHPCMADAHVWEQGRAREAQQAAL